MREVFRQSKTFPPTRQLGSLPCVNTKGEIDSGVFNYGFRFGYLDLDYKKKLFETAQATLQPDAPEEVHHQLNEMTNDLCSFGVYDFNWAVSTKVARSHPDIQRAMDRMREPDEAPDDGINQLSLLCYSRFGHSALHLARIPGNFADEIRLDPNELPVSMELTTNGGPEVLMWRNECSIRTYYPLPPEYRVQPQ